MTTAAWDGHELVADTQGNWCGTRFSAEKAFKLKNGWLVAMSGDRNYAYAMVVWIEAGMDVREFPSMPAGSATLLVIGPGFVRRFESSPYPIDLKEKFTAIGSGADYALGAMAHGATAREAVEIAKMLNVDTGGDLTVLRL